jgi:hypothetical protein
MKQSSSSYRVTILPLLLLHLPLILLVQLLTTTRVVFFVRAAAEDDESRSITIVNESGRRVEINWINPEDGKLELQSDPDVLHGATFDLNSFVGHDFEVRELAVRKTGVCAGEGQTCRVDHFTVNSNQDQGESSHT